ncbi:MAG TPA: hypothetical protein VJN69_03785 [Candidatus Acidoferrales bacterium]|nr:hypothetical protein [Candidatus Acidoferrales bacterium]
MTIDERQHVVGDMVHKLIYRLHPLSASRTADHDNAAASFRHRGRLVQKVVKAVPEEFGAGLFDCHHGVSLSRPRTGDSFQHVRNIHNEVSLTTARVLTTIMA